MSDIQFSLGKVEMINWLLLLVLCLGGVLVTDPHITTSILIGGAIANFSFGFLKKDLTKLFAGSLDGVKGRFFVRYYLRFLVLVALLFLLVQRQLVDVIGLLVGLSTVVMSIMFTLIIETKKVYLNNVKEAS